jgi:hypothetical protein
MCTGCATRIKNYVSLSTPISGDRPTETVPEEWTVQSLANRVLPGGLEMELLDEDYCILTKEGIGDILIYKHTDEFQKELESATESFPSEDMGKSMLDGYRLLKVRFNERYVDYYMYKEDGYIFRFELYNESDFDKFMLYIKELIS